MQLTDSFGARGVNDVQALSSEATVPTTLAGSLKLVGEEPVAELGIVAVQIEEWFVTSRGGASRVGAAPARTAPAARETVRHAVVDIGLAHPAPHRLDRDSEIGGDVMDRHRRGEPRGPRHAALTPSGKLSWASDTPSARPRRA